MNVLRKKSGKPLSSMALLMLLWRMGRADLTAHGFRSTFSEWAAEATNYPREVAELALAHVNKDKVEAAYQRDDVREAASADGGLGRVLRQAGGACRC
jgi:integrase